MYSIFSFLMHAAQSLPDTPCIVIVFFFLVRSLRWNRISEGLRGKATPHNLSGKILDAFIHFSSSILVDFFCPLLKAPTLLKQITVT